MKCSCPWCAKLAKKGCESFSGLPTCEGHDWRAVLTLVKQSLLPRAKTHQPTKEEGHA